MFNSIGKMFSSNSNLGLLLARVYFGGSIAYNHGLGKLMDLEKFTGFVSQHFPMAQPFAIMAALTEVLGGILLAVGLFSRGASFFLFVNMVTAILVVHRLDPFHVKELAVTYAAAYLLFLFVGAGKFSLDGLFRKVV